MKKSRQIKSREEAKMFAFFLAMERNRHIEDIQKIDIDIQNLV